MSQQFPEPIVGAFIFNPQHKIFLMKSHKWHDTYVVPGGHIEIGESMEQALKREVKEETNLDIFDPKFICYREFIFGGSSVKKKHFIFFNFACKTTDTDVQLDDEGQEYIWLDLKDKEKYPIQPDTEATIELYLQSKKS